MQLSSLSLALTRAGFLAFNPLSLFSAGQPGVWYDPSDMTTLFQDSAGTTPVTAVEQPVGLMLDKSKGLVLGPELMTNGDFSDGLTNWVATASVSAVSGGASIDTTVNADQNIYQTFSCVIGSTYVVSVNIKTIAPGGTLLVQIRNSANSASIQAITNPSTGVLRFYFVATEATHIFRVFQNTSSSGATLIDDVTSKLIPGNHATQSTSTSRPVLSARYNLLTKTEQFSDAIWTKTRLSITANSTTAPDGTLTADTLVENTDNNSHTLSTSISLTAGASNVVSAYVKDAGREWVVLSLPSAAFGGTTTRAFFNINTGTLGTQQNGTATVTSVGDGWYWCTFTATPTVTTTGSLTVLLSSANGSSSYQGNGTSGIYLWGAQLIVTNSLTSNAYQRVDTSTVYDSDATKFPAYLKFDGVDDGMITPTITPGTDKVQVFAGVRKLSDAAIAIIVESSSSVATNDGAFAFLAPNSAAGTNYSYRTRGTLTSAATYSNAAIAAPTTDVLTGISDISGDVTTLRVDGVQRTTSSSDLGTGNYLAYPLYIGRRNGASSPFNGQLYSLITRFGPNLSTATIQQTESYVAQKTGITL